MSVNLCSILTKMIVIPISSESFCNRYLSNALTSPVLTVKSYILICIIAQLAALALFSFYVDDQNFEEKSFAANIEEMKVIFYNRNFQAIFLFSFIKIFSCRFASCALKHLLYGVGFEREFSEIFDSCSQVLFTLFLIFGTNASSSIIECKNMLLNSFFYQVWSYSFLMLFPITRDFTNFGYSLAFVVELTYAFSERFYNSQNANFIYKIQKRSKVNYLISLAICIELLALSLGNFFFLKVVTLVDPYYLTILSITATLCLYFLYGEELEKLEGLTEENWKIKSD